MGEEERGREQPDDREPDAVLVREQPRDRADVGDVPRNGDAERQRSDEA
jgi:hypothetical protein